VLANLNFKNGLDSLKSGKSPYLPGSQRKNQQREVKLPQPMPLQMPKRTRGYILTPKGAKKLQDAKREWESQHSAGCTEEKMRELTSPFKENGLDPGTLVEFQKGGYWLHSVIREESIARIVNTLDCKIANICAFGFWVKSSFELTQFDFKDETTIRDEAILLESIYHILDGQLETEDQVIEVEKSLETNLVEFEDLLDFAYEMAIDSYRNGLFSQREGNLLKSRKYFQAAILIFSQLQETELVEKVKQVMENKENSYAYAELLYEDGLVLQENGEVDESRQYFQYAILLFNQVGAFEKTEEVRRAIATGE
jgi:tetratricopeptide (TPR) repeat protein